MTSKKQSSRTIAFGFRGRGDRHRLLSSLQEQFLVGGDLAIAQMLQRKSEVKMFRQNKLLMEQGSEDTHLAMILSGKVEIIVNGRVVASRMAGDHVGEMALIKSYARRSATVRAVEDTTVAVISEYEFNKVAEKYPLLWRRLALRLEVRLREREKFHVPPRELPSVFIASSSEGLPVAERIFESLKRSRVVPYLWSRGVFEAGKTTIEELVRKAGESDFAIVIASPDDVTICRSKTKTSPRDNVIFELGLFMGAISRERTLVLVPEGIDLKIPSDLLGMTHIPYSPYKKRDSSKSIKGAMKILRGQIRKYGPR